MSFFQWRRFNFFDLVKNVDNKALSQLFKDITITAWASGRGHIVLGDSEGCVHLLERDFSLSTFQAHEFKITHLHQVKQSSVLVTLGEDELGTNVVVKVWQLDKRDEQRQPLCVHTLRVMPSRPSHATALAVDESLTMLVVGFMDGSVILHRGDISRDRHWKARSLQEGGASVSGLAFKPASKTTHLWVATTQQLMCYNVLQKDQEQQVVLDNFGCEARCCVMADAKQEHQFMIARQDAVYCYTTDSRGPCYAFEGEKIMLEWFRGYLAVLAKEKDGEGTRVTLTLLDVQHRLLAFSLPVKDIEIQGLVAEWGSLFLLSKDKNLHRLVEKDLQSKLDLLFRKNLYDIAIRLAKSQHYDSEGLADLFKQYGDHLYAKGNHVGAMEQYVKTIGKLEPSYVIKRFLDAQRIHSLTSYLQELHRQGLANEDHTTLLLHCYTKLRDTQHLDHFLNTKETTTEFDVETAIRVCRQSGYYVQALRLAKECVKPHLYLKIELEDLQDFKGALRYIENLSPSEAKFSIMEYGNVLLQNLPDETTELLVKMCQDQETMPDPDEFSVLFLQHPSHLLEFLEKVTKTRPDCSANMSTTLLEQYVIQIWQTTDSLDKSKLEKKALALLQQPQSKNFSESALFHCQLHQFWPGVLLLYEKMKLYRPLLDIHLNREEYDSVLNACKRFGAQEPKLWLQALSALAKKSNAPPHVLQEILQVIEKRRLLSPLKTLELLSPSPAASLGLVKDLLLRWLQGEQAVVAEDQRLLVRYEKDTEELRKKIVSIQNEPLVFQGSKCHACQQPLELPSCHFLCLHSFHQHCFESYADSETECPACLPENRKILDILKAQEHSQEMQEAFHSQLEKSDDVFAVVAEYLGRGVFTQAIFIPQEIPKPVRLEEKPVPSYNVGLGAEARLRKAEGKSVVQAQVQNLPSEARLRTAEKQICVENSNIGTSEGRQRLQEGSQVPSSSTGLKRDMSSPNVSESVPKSMHLASVMAKKHSTTTTSSTLSSSLSDTKMSEDFPSRMTSFNKSQNGSAVKMTSPESVASSNPFGEVDTSNPFDEEEDYDESLNPFSD